MTQKHEVYLKQVQESLNRIRIASKEEFEWLLVQLRETEKENRQLKRGLKTLRQRLATDIAFAQYVEE